MAATQKKRTTTKAKAAKPAARKPAAKKAPAKTTTSARKAAPAAKKPVAKAPARKPTAAKKRAVKKPPFTPAFIAKQRKLLEEERARFLQQAQDKQQEADQLVADREPGDVQFDEESGEGDSIAVERSLDLALSAQAQDAVRQIDDALDRIERGVYGICIISGDPIPIARLEAIPWAAEQVKYKVGKLGS